MQGLKLNFAVVGPQKAGTTWIYEYIKKYPQACLPSLVKETFFFDRNFDKGYGWYYRHFQRSGADILFGEVAPTYFDAPCVPQRIYEHNPEIKIIITLRNPYARTWSLYLHQLKYGMAKGTFREATRDDPRILSSSMYATHIKRWQKVFGAEQVLVVFQDELKNAPYSYIKKICSLLKLPCLKDKELLHERINASEMSRSVALAGVANHSAHFLRSYQLYGVVNLAKKLGFKKLVFGGGAIPEGPTEEDIAIMESAFAGEVQRLEDLLAIDLGHWIPEIET